MFNNGSAPTATATATADIFKTVLHNGAAATATNTNTTSLADTKMDLLHQLDASNVSDSSDTDDFLQELAALNDVAHIAPIIEAGLLRATMESLECGRLTPLIKEELRCRIQSRRLSEGKEELLVEFPSPTPSQPRPDEVEKRDRRREQNRRAAQKFRKKKKERGEHLIEETQRLECHNTSLRSEIKQLHEEREQLTRIIQSHASICPLTPRQSPLTIPRESPLLGPIRESSLPLPSSSGNILAVSPVMDKSSVLAQSPAILVPPTRESPVPLLIINSSGDSSIPASLIPSSPVPMCSRPRKSPVSLLRLNQSPVPGDKFGAKSPIPFGSPAKQSKHSIPPRLNLAGPKPVVPILPKPAPTASQSSPSPKTPKTVITSPLPIAPSPVSGGRAIHVSPVFFRDGCFTPSAHGRQANQSPLSVSDSSSSSTPGRITQPSPVFFGDRAPSSAQAGTLFLQPLSASSVSSTSSLANLLRQESPLSVLSNSSGISNASSVFISNTTNISSNTAVMDGNAIVSNNSVTNNSNNSFDYPNSASDKPRSVYSCSSQGSIPENPEDNVLSLEDIEKSASGFEARDDLLDFMDIQALLELSGDHSGSTPGESGTGEAGNGAEFESLSETRNSLEDLHVPHASDATDSNSGQNVGVSNSGQNGGVSNSGQNVGVSNSGQNVGALMGRENGLNTQSGLQPQNQRLCLTTLAQNVNMPGAKLGQNLQVLVSTLNPNRNRDSFATDTDISRSHSAFVNRNICHFEDSFELEQKNAFRNLRGTTDETAIQTYSESQHGVSINPTSIQQFHKQLGELIKAHSLQREPEEHSSPRTLPGCNAADVLAARNNQGRSGLAGDSRNCLNNCYLHTEGDIQAGSSDASDSDLINLHSSLPLEIFVTSHNACNTSSENVISQTTHYT